MKRQSDTARRMQGKDQENHHRPDRVLSTRFLAAVTALALFAASNLHGQQPRPSEYAVKATYIYNFGRFVKWPASTDANEPFAICILGHDPFGATLDTTLRGEVIEGRSAQAKRISKPQDATGCRVLFISSSEDARLKEILAALNNAAVLTVSDIPHFSQRGGMIEFVADGGRIRFEVNLKATEEVGLVLSSDLLKVAVTVRRSSQPGD